MDKKKKLKIALLIAVSVAFGAGNAFASENFFPTDNGDTVITVQSETDSESSVVAGTFSQEEIDAYLPDDITRSTAPIDATDPTVDGDNTFYLLDSPSGDTVIHGLVWNDTYRDGIYDPGSEFGIPGVTVTLYAGALPFDLHTIDSTTTDQDGNYAFSYKMIDNEFYSVEFTNSNASTMQFTQSPTSGVVSAQSYYSHVSNVVESGALALGTTEAFDISAADSGLCQVNAGLCEFPTVSYDAGAAGSAAANMPVSGSEKTGLLYTIPTQVPTWAGHVFEGWVVTENALYNPNSAAPDEPILNAEYAAGDEFRMNWSDIVLTAQWSSPVIHGYTNAYDGAPHGVTVTDQQGNPWQVEGDKISYYVTKGSSLVSSANQFTDVTSVKVTAVITRNGGSETVWQDSATVQIVPLDVYVSTSNRNKNYDGTPLEGVGEVQVKNAAGSDTFSSKATTVALLTNNYVRETGTISATGSQLNAGTSNSGCSALVFNGTAKASNYNVIYTYGKLTVDPARLDIIIPTLSKTFDGTALNATSAKITVAGLTAKDEATVKVKASGSQTAVGISKITYTIDWGTALKSNYSIQADIGSLVVSSSGIVVMTNGTYTYDGQPHSAKVDVIFSGYEANVMPQGYTLVQAKSSVTATEVLDTPIAVSCDSLIITDATGKDVTAELDIEFIEGKLTIEPAPLTVTTSSATKVYDGTSLVAGGTAKGFVNNETADFAVTGSQTEVGSSTNTYTLTWNDVNTKSNNYKVIEDLGTLTVEGSAVGGTTNNAGTGTTTPASTANNAATNVAEAAVTGAADALSNDIEDGTAEGGATGNGNTGNGITKTPNETTIGDSETPLDGIVSGTQSLTLPILIGLLFTCAYAIVVVAHRRTFTGALNKYDNDLTGKN